MRLDVGRLARTGVEALYERIRALDAGVRPIVLGYGIAALLALAMILAVDDDLAFLGWAVTIVAVFAPSTGLTIIAGLALLREPAGLGPLGFNATVIGASALGIAARQVLAGWAGRQITVRPEIASIGAFIGLSVVQFLRLVARTPVERERFGLAQLLATCAGLLVVVLVPAVFTKENRRWLVAALVPGIILAAVTAILSLSPALIALLPLGGLLPPVDLSARATGIFRNPNYLGEGMALAFFVVALARRLDLPLFARYPIALAVPVALAAVASFSRGALLALVGGVVTQYASRGRKVLVVAALVGVVVVGVGYPIVLGARHLVNFGPRIEDSDAAQAESDSTRIAILQAGARLFARQPLLGIGIGQFHYESAQLVGDSPVTFSHNQFLQIIVEQGVLGFTAFVVMLVTLILALTRIGDPYSQAARSMLVVFAIGSVFAEPLTTMQTSAVLWVVLGAALVRAGMAGGPATHVGGSASTLSRGWQRTEPGIQRHA